MEESETTEELKKNVNPELIKYPTVELNLTNMVPKIEIAPHSGILEADIKKLDVWKQLEQCKEKTLYYPKSLDEFFKEIKSNQRLIFKQRSEFEDTHNLNLFGNLILKF